MTSTWGDPALISGHATRRPRTEAEAKADVARKRWEESIAVIRSKLRAAYPEACLELLRTCDLEAVLTAEEIRRWDMQVGSDDEDRSRRWEG